MSTPTHIEQTNKQRMGHAPYNFIPLFEELVEFDLDEARSAKHSKFDTNLRTGSILIKLVSKSSIFVRGPFTLTQHEEAEKQRSEESSEGESAVQYRNKVANKVGFFYVDPQSKEPVIPGSSLRGLFRSLLEIVSFGKITRVTNDKFRYKKPDGWKVDGKYSPYDLIPDQLKDQSKLDLADVIFGFVGYGEKRDESYAGRVRFSDAKCLSSAGFDDAADVILSNPKPRSYQCYLTQKSDNEKQLYHYCNKKTETTIRGHKMYWHQGHVTAKDVHDTEVKPSSTQHSRLTPLKAGSEFQFQIDFENLQDHELGALLWLIELPGPTLPDGAEYCHKIGGGKPYGLGSVKLEIRDLSLINPQDRYSCLFQTDDDGTFKWGTGVVPQPGEDTHSSRNKLIESFESFVLERIKKGQAKRLSDHKRIQELLRMLTWPGLNRKSAEYMKFTSREIRNRNVLPTPRVVLAKGALQLEDPTAQNPSFEGGRAFDVGQPVAALVLDVQRLGSKKFKVIFQLKTDKQEVVELEKESYSMSLKGKPVTLTITSVGSDGRITGVTNVA